MNHIEKLLPSIIIIHITKVTHRSLTLRFLYFFRIESSFISHRNGDHAATPAFVGRLEERANIAQKLQSAKESVYLSHKVRVAYRRDNFKLRSRQKYSLFPKNGLAVTYLTIFVDSNPRPCSGTYFGRDFGVLVLIPTESL